MTSTKPISSKVYFRCDASAIYGGGHVMRCLSLAKALQSHGWSCSFLTISESKDMIPDLQNFELLEPDYKPDGADLLIVDHYDLDKAYESESRQWAKKIMVIDDLANRAHDCDVLVDQTMGRDAADYKEFVTENCDILCGSEYTLLRTQFLEKIENAKQKRRDVERAETVLVTFGSTNPDNIIQKVLSTLVKFTSWPLTIDVVASRHAEAIKEIQELAIKITSETIHSVEINLDVQNMADFMLDADLSVGGGGTTSWERACLGLPTILIELSPDQKTVAQNLNELGAVQYLGDLQHVQEADIDKAFENMRENKQLLGRMSEKAFSVCDGLGVDRICKIIETTMQEKAA